MCGLQICFVILIWICGKQIGQRRRSEVALILLLVVGIIRNPLDFITKPNIRWPPIPQTVEQKLNQTYQSLVSALIVPISAWSLTQPSRLSPLVFKHHHFSAQSHENYAKSIFIEHSIEQNVFDWSCIETYFQLFFK